MHSHGVAQVRIVLQKPSGYHIQGAIRYQRRLSCIVGVEVRWTIIVVGRV